MVPESISLASITENSTKERKAVLGRLQVTERPLQSVLVSKKDNLSFLVRVVFPTHRLKTSNIIMHPWKTKNRVPLSCGKSRLLLTLFMARHVPLGSCASV